MFALFILGEAISEVSTVLSPSHVTQKQFGFGQRNLSGLSWVSEGWDLMGR